MPGLNSRRALVASLVLAMSAGASTAQPHVFTIEARAPASVGPGETFTVEFWGHVQSPQFIEGVSAIAGFGISALGEGSIASLTTATFYALDSGNNAGTIAGTSLVNVIGGQLPPFPFDCWFPPCLDLSNPMLLFSFDVTAGDYGRIDYTPGLPNPNGALAFFPNWQAGASINSNAPGSTLTLVGTTTWVVPEPASMSLAAVGAVALLRGRRRASTGVTT